MASDAAGIRLAGSSSHPQHKPPPYARDKTTCTQSPTSSAGSSQPLPPPYPSSSPSSSSSSSINGKAESVGDKQSNGKPTAAPLRPRYIKNCKDKRTKVKISNPGTASSSPCTTSSFSRSVIVTDV